MSYQNPTIPLITNPTGLDKVIQDIQEAFANGLPWLHKSFGRAWLHQEVDSSGKTVKYPKCYDGSGEYTNVLPNDNFESMCFIAARGQEKPEEFNNLAKGNHKTRDLSIYFWGNLTTIDENKTYIFTEVLKKDIEKILVNYVASINAYYDEKAETIFQDYTLSDVNTQYLMHPYFALRFDITVKYFENYC